MKLEEKTISSRLIHKGRIIALYEDEVLLPNDKLSHREYVTHNGGAAILALDQEDNIYLVKQFRYPYHKELLEIPAGKLEQGENPMSCAERELKEETGWSAESIVPFGVIYPTPGYTNEVLYIYKAIVSQKGATHFDDNEFIDLVKIPLYSALEMVLSGEIKDGKTSYAILRITAERVSRS